MSKQKEKSLAIQARNELHLTFDEIVELLRKDGYHVSKGALHKWFVKEEINKRIKKNGTKTD